MGEPGGLPSMGLHRVRHNGSDLAAAAAAVCICHSQTPTFALTSPEILFLSVNIFYMLEFSSFEILKLMMNKCRYQTKKLQDCL